IRTGPAIKAETPSKAARLKTFDPTTTPTPVSSCPATTAATAEAISGASAPTAVTIPSSASEKPRRSPIRSSSRASTTLEMTVRANAPARSSSATGIDMASEPSRPVWQTRHVPATVIVGAQWGDEGKGKIVDLLAQDSDLVCRYQGGPNAGHTIVVDGDTFKIRQIPSGVLRGKTCVIGAGCVIDPEVFLAEVDELEGRGISTADVHLSGEAHLVMPWHVAIDQASERRLGSLQIGTTKRGIGPCYADKAARLGIRVQDLLDPSILRKKIMAAMEPKRHVLRPHAKDPMLDLHTMTEEYVTFGHRLEPHITDTAMLCYETLQEDGTVVFEGAQGTLLDIDHGTYPFVTSSNPIAGAACVGAGVGPKAIDEVWGVAKA